ncbi:hypothetical protein TcCL_ESM09570 [Trypanosoma cruzi]|nr:hypothetical protein TcCL_ESM09570 [Trypanosoma cruzi]
MHADDRTLVALGADGRACGAAVQAAVSVVATWAAEHSLKINTDRSGAALFCIASRRQSDEDTADHRLGGGKPRVNPTLCVCSAMRLIDTSISVCTSPPLHSSSYPFAVGRVWAQELGRRSSTMRSFLVGCVHSALHHGVEAKAPCPASNYLHSLEVRHGDSCTASLGPRAPTKDTSAHLEANLAPLRRIVGFRAPTRHERLTRLRYIVGVRGAIFLKTMP